ncbi:glycosyltransferase family 39 protein [Patescibacteria group bacterium]|nr:glycosyltransferase family 39 protein [Patescibacteria group bacterium]
MSNRFTYAIAFLLLIISFTLCFFTLFDDCWTFDETAHIASGYSYLTQHDFRLNPEHPPLIKDLAAAPLLFLNLNFPKEHSAWLQEGDPVWWLQFDFASQFLYQAGNNPDQILLFARIPMILLFLFLAWFVFFWTKKLFGNKTALLSLFFIALSPTFLAHGRLVTTDIGAALGTVIATCVWLKFLKKPSWKNVLLAAFILGISLLLKFSLILLIPFLGIITLFYAWVYKKPFLKYIALSTLIGLIALIFVIWPIYQAHTFNYPVQQQLKDTVFRLESASAPEFIAEPLLWMSDKPTLRSLGHYFTGIVMTVSRAGGGNTTFFMGQMSAEAWKSYFPIVYLIKEPLPFHILTLLALIWSLYSIFRKKKIAVRKLLSKYFTEFAMFIFLIIYWTVSIKGNLNIGVRHLLPVFPFTIILVSRATISWLKEPALKIKYIFVGLLLLWQAVSVIQIYPSFLAYFNELVGGPANGYEFVTDSNIDWGQDLRRLTAFVEENKIDKIYLNYFGGGSPTYYLGARYQKWDAKQKPDQLPPNSWLAISINELQGGRATPVKGFDQKTDYYNWLNRYEPTAIIGHSIFVYHL